MKVSPIQRMSEKLGVTPQRIRELVKARSPRVAEILMPETAGMGKSSKPEKGSATARKYVEQAEADVLKIRGEHRPVAATKALGLGASLQRLRAYEHQLAQELDAARKAGKLDLEAAISKKWVAVSEQLRKTEKDAPDVDLQNKDSLPLGDVETAWMRGLSVFRKGVEGMARRVVTKPALGFDDAKKVDVEQAILDEVARMFAELSKTDWSRVK